MEDDVIGLAHIVSCLLMYAKVRFERAFVVNRRQGPNDARYGPQTWLKQGERGALKGKSSTATVELFHRREFLKPCACSAFRLNKWLGSLFYLFHPDIAADDKERTENS